MTEENRTPIEADDSRASHEALKAATNEFRAWAQATADEQLGVVSEEITEKASDALRTKYREVLVKHGGSDGHQGWECDLDPARDWWYKTPDASDEEWFAELETWGWIDLVGEWRERPAPKPIEVLVLLKEESHACPEAMTIEQAAVKIQLDAESIAWALDGYGRCDTETWIVTALDPEMANVYRDRD